MTVISNNGINTLNIKPILVHKGEKRETSITSFDTMLRSAESSDLQKNNKKTKSNVKITDLTPDATEVENSTKKTENNEKITNNSNTTGKTNTVDEVKTENNIDTDTKNIANSATTVSPNKSAISAASMKKTKYDSIFKKAAKKYGLEESLLKAVAKAESDFNPKSLSSSGAMGVMQLMPETVRELGINNPYDPEENIMGGAKELAMKLKTFGGNLKLALAAYNAGTGAVKRAGGIPSKSKVYVKRVLSYKEAYETASKV